MNVGMLWFDANRKISLLEKVTQAANYYHDKYGRSPNTCYANPGTIGNEAPLQIAGLRLRTSPLVLPDHFWLGIREEREQESEPRIEKAA